MARLGRVPQVGDEAPVPATPEGADGWVLRVLELDGRRVSRVAIRVVEPPPTVQPVQVIATIPMPMLPPRREPATESATARD
jgi:putative hemolysin